MNRKVIQVLYATFLVLASQSAFSAVPQAETTSGGTAVTDGFWAWLTDWFQDIVTFGVPAVLSLVFLWCLWELISKINEQRREKQPEWGGVLAFGGATGVYFVVAMGISAIILNLFA